MKLAAEIVRFVPLFLILVEATFGFKLFDVWVNFVCFILLTELADALPWPDEEDDDNDDDDTDGATPVKGNLSDDKESVPSLV